MAFVHLHNHTEYSLLDGAAKIDDLVAKAAAYGMPACAITDHGVMYGVIDFYTKAKKAGIKPIIGCEVYVCNDRFSRSGRKGDTACHLILLAENNEGYRNLCRIVSIGSLEGFYYKPRVDKEVLRRYSKGIICLSACIAGEVPEKILSGDLEGAKSIAKEYLDIFGPDHYFIEIQNHGLREELICIPHLLRIADELSLKVVATNDLHYVDASDAEMHDILLCIQTGKIRSDENRMRFANDQFYLKTEQEMAALFPDRPDALANTLEIAQRCQVDFEFGKLYMPNYQVPPGYDLQSYLRHLCQEGLNRLYQPVTPEIQERMEYELSIINRLDFPGYFLIVWDMINYARQQGISVGPGRGSAAGSIVAYCLGITNIDPLKYDLLFERFLNPERVTPPDIDTDISDLRRGEVVDYLVRKYGEEHVSQIVTFNFMLMKGAVRAVGRVLNMPYADVDKVVKLMPEDPKIKTIDKAMELSPDLRYIYENDPQVKELLDIADKIQGMPSHCGKHAAGVAIAQNELVSYMPVQKDNKDGSVTTQYPKEQVEACGLVKMDLLGLRTLSVIDDAVENIEKSRGIKIDMDSIPLDDPATYTMLSEGDAIAVFQLESEGMRKILKNLRPERFEDIIALVALYRPGPLGSGMVDDFIDGKHGLKKVTYMHPSMESIVRETYGVILYQEQVMQIVQVLGGFSLGKADMIRRAMGKKKIEIINAARDDFVNGCKNNHIDQKTAEEIFELLKKFGEYGFNKSHSAAYALVSYRTAWLKANYPAEFMAAMMTSVMDTVDKVPEYIEECKRMGITVLPPSINESGVKFNVVDGKIRYAMSAVKNVGREAVKKIVEEREANGPYVSLADLCQRQLLNRKVLESLIRCGALDNLGSNRATMLASIDRALELSKKANADKESDQLSLFDFGMDDASGGASIQLIETAEYPFKQLLAMEKEMIGFYVSGHPLDVYGEQLYRKASHRIGQLTEAENGTKIKTAGMISGLVRRITKKGDPMASFVLEDQQNSIHCAIFPKTYEKLQHMVAEGRAVLVAARVRNENGLAELTIDDIQSPLKLYLRFADSQDYNFLQKARSLMLDYPGMIEVRAYFNDLQTYNDFPGISGVDIDKNLLQSLRLVLGEANVVAQ